MPIEKPAAMTMSKRQAVARMTEQPVRTVRNHWLIATRLDGEGEVFAPVYECSKPRDDGAYATDEAEPRSDGNGSRLIWCRPGACGKT